MWMLCFLELTFLASCYAQLEVAYPVAKILEEMRVSTKSKIGKWSYMPLTCDSPQNTLCIAYEAEGDYYKCLCVCATNEASYDFSARRTVKFLCTSRSSPSCIFSQWSPEFIECTGPTITALINENGQIHSSRIPFYTCLENDCNVCPSGKVFHDTAVPCQKSCDNSAPRCQFRPQPGCGCRSDQYWNGLECVDQCEECPPGVTRVLCKQDPCKALKCLKHRNAKCKPHFCGGCNAKFYLNGNYIPSAACDINCEQDYWVKCFSKEIYNCPVCTNGCKCKLRKATDADLKRMGREGCWSIYDCFHP